MFFLLYILISYLTFRLIEEMYSRTKLLCPISINYGHSGAKIQVDIFLGKL